MRRTPPIGSMRERLTLEHAVRTADGGGGAGVAWQPVATLWAAVRTLSGDERLRHDQVSGRLTHEVWLRERPGVQPAMRLREGTRIYAIVAVIQAPRRRFLQCLCEELPL